MGIFDEDINLKNLETIALFKQIRAIVDWIIDNLSQYHEVVLYDASPLSILRKNVYDTDIIPDEMQRTSDMWDRMVGSSIVGCYKTPNYNTELITMEQFDIATPLNSTYKKLNFIFSRVEIVIINGDPYVRCIGNNIIHMRYFHSIPDFIKFLGYPYIVITSKIEEDKIRGYRCDCKFIVYGENYTLNNVTEEPYDIRINNIRYTPDNDTSLNVTNDGKWICKVDYSKEMSYGTVQNVCSKTIGWGLIPIQV
jgi:hypothetical protein